MVLCDPELTRQVLCNDRVFDKGGAFFERAREVLGENLGTCPYSRHREQRRTVQPAFHQTRLAAYATIMTDQVVSMTSAWRHGQVLDVFSEMMGFTSRSLTAALFTDSLPGPVLHQALEDVGTVLAGWYLRLALPRPLRRLPPRAIAATNRPTPASGVLCESSSTPLRCTVNCWAPWASEPRAWRIPDSSIRS